MTEPMRESSCGRCRALDLVVVEKEERIKELEKHLDNHKVAGDKLCADALDICSKADKEVASLRTLVKELGGALERYSRIDYFMWLSESSDGRMSDPTKIAQEALLLIPEELRKEMEK